jgi:Transcriptional Coactivator p15 (PC4)
VDTIIAELQKNPLEKLCIGLREYQGHTFVDLRLYFLGDDEAWHPTKKGVTVSPAQWADFVAAVGHVEAHLPAGETSASRPRGAKR